ncbi:MAG: tRNA (guanosine(46)-N7)-methyltransferase TrmB [Chitinophagaceae bacterium]
MGHKKLIRFAELDMLPNVFQKLEAVAGTWHTLFGNKNPITLELACGKGEYTIALAKKYPNRNFIGIDIKGNRIWVGAKKALQENLKNVFFLRCSIEQLDNYFLAKEVSEIWITFPDPQLRKSRAKKRLTHHRFLILYKKIISTKGIIHIKTDSPLLYAFSVESLSLFHAHILHSYDDAYKQIHLPEEVYIPTYYESLDIAQSKHIHYIQFQLS